MSITKEELKVELKILDEKIENFTCDDLSDKEIDLLSYEFIEHINLILGPIELMPGVSCFNRASVIEKSDPYLYKQMFNDYLDNLHDSSILENTESYLNLLESKRFLEKYLVELEKPI